MQGASAELNGVASSWCALPEEAEWLWDRLKTLSGSSETKSQLQTAAPVKNSHGS